MPHGHLDARVIIVYGLLAMIGAARAETPGEAASTCAIAAGDMVAALGRGDSKAATSRFDAPLRRALPEPTLSGVWDATISAHGAYVGHGTPTSAPVRPSFRSWPPSRCALLPAPSMASSPAMRRAK